MITESGIEMGLGGVFWERFGEKGETLWEELRDSDQVAEFTAMTSAKTAGMEGEMEAEYLREQLHAFVLQLGQSRGLQPDDIPDDKLDLGEEILDMEDFEERISPLV